MLHSPFVSVHLQEAISMVLSVLSCAVFLYLTVEVSKLELKAADPDFSRVS
jgi:hypothetical protein